MRIHLLSDIHIEARRPPPRVKGQPKPLPTFKPTVTDTDVVVLAGDIHSKVRGVDWAREAFPNSQVIYVPGNHEYWSGNVQRTTAKMKAAAVGTNVHVLQRDAIVIDGVRFLGATGWTDFTSTGAMPIAMWDAQQIMRDYKRIRHREGYLRWRPQDAQNQAILTKTWLRQQLEQPFDGKTIVVTHHPMCMESVVDTHEKNPHLDASYGNRWEDLFGPAVDFHFHGHTHRAVRYNVYGTEVIANPVGHAFEDTDYDPWLVIEV